MENGKSPGIDGLAIEFYKSLFDLIKSYLLQLYNSILFQDENLIPSMTKAIINLIPKNDQKERLKLETNLLTLLDYKILTKILSNRLKPLQISKEQTCGIPNRSTFSNLFTIRELITCSTTKKIKTYIISVEQEKPFDKVDREFLYKIMKKLEH